MSREEMLMDVENWLDQREEERTRRDEDFEQQYARELMSSGCSKTLVRALIESGDGWEL